MSGARRILLVDDEDDIRTIAEMSLGAVGGFEVVTASSGAAALEIAGRERFDGVLLDVMMPELDGPSTLARLRETGVDVPVVFLTAKVQASDREALEAAGAAGVIAKPFDPMELPDQVRAILG